MKRWIISLCALALMSSIVSCEKDDVKEDGNDDSGPVVADVTLKEFTSPTNPCSPDQNHSCFGYYKAVVPEMRAELSLSIGNEATANLYWEGLVEEFSCKLPVTAADLSQGITFTAEDNMSFRFTVDADGANPVIDQIQISGYESLHAMVLKGTSEEYVDAFLGESVWILHPHPPVCALRKGNKLYLTFDDPSIVYELDCSHNSFLYQKEDIKIEGSIGDNLIISGWFWSDKGGMEFNLLNRDYFSNTQAILTDDILDTTPYDIPGADFRYLQALQTEHYFCLGITCTGSMSQFWFHYIFHEGFASIGVIMADNKGYNVDRDKAGRMEGMTYTSFSKVNDYVVRDEKTLYLIVEKQWAIYTDNEVEFYLVSEYLPTKVLDRTGKVIVKLE